MKIRAKALVLLALCGSATAGDLVLKLGTAGNYRYHRIPVTGSVTVSPATGDITVDPVADAGTSLDGWCPASGGGGGSAPVFTQQLQASTTSLSSAGGSVTLSWTVSGQTGCTASSSGVSGWNGGTVTSPTALTLPANTGTSAVNYSFGVTCSNGNGSTSGGTVSVSVAGTSGGTGNQECSSRPAPVGITQQTTMTNYNLGGTLNQQNNEFPLGGSINITGYVPLLGTSFNQPNQVARLFLFPNNYAALSFSTTGVATGATGHVSWEQVASGLFSAQISPCPGDFDWVVDANCKASGIASALTWKIGTKPQSNPGFYCYLDPNKTYYLNVVSSDNGTWTTNTCGSTYCTWLVSVGGT
ncbi:MAG TPA: hypothetical protein PLB00_06435 [Pseudomonadota bacterium]|nr:hypothetical protein [Pseudomonadota bacterium]